MNDIYYLYTIYKQAVINEALILLICTALKKQIKKHHPLP